MKARSVISAVCQMTYVNTFFLGRSFLCGCFQPVLRSQNLAALLRMIALALFVRLSPPNMDGADAKSPPISQRAVEYRFLL